MDFLTIFNFGDIDGDEDEEPMVFDWHKAAQLIKERKPNWVGAGLQDDWGWTGGTIFRDGKPLVGEDAEDAEDVFLSSTWAVPEINLDGKIEECYLMQSEMPEWDAYTYWPESALEILSK